MRALVYLFLFAVTFIIMLLVEGWKYIYMIGTKTDSILNREGDIYPTDKL